MASLRVCFISDLHLRPYQGATAARVQLVQVAVAPCDLLIYSGDVLMMDECHGKVAACVTHLAMARRFVDAIAKPFLFTLGNHDGEPGLPPRQELARRLNASAHHGGLNACVHSACTRRSA